MRKQNFFVSGPKFINFFAQQERGCSWSLAIPIFDISIRCRDIISQNVKFSKIACSAEFWWVRMRQQNFFASGQNFMFFVQQGISCSSSLAIPRPTGFQTCQHMTYTQLYSTANRSLLTLSDIWLRDNTAIA